jgi:hypothetical protein
VIGSRDALARGAMTKVSVVLTALVVGLLLVGAVTTSPARGDSGTNLEQHSEGACSPPIASNSGSITIQCSGLSKEVSDQIIQILNKILSSQADQKEILRQLSDLSKGYDALAARSIDAQRGVISIYDFNGAKREQVAGRMSVTIGAESTAFQEMGRLESQKQWNDLIALCETQISKTPEWLTPYLFAGKSYAILGDTSKALARLEYVVSHAGSDPQYQLATKWVAELKTQH